MGRTHRSLGICCLRRDVLLWEHKLYLRLFSWSLSSVLRSMLANTWKLVSELPALFTREAPFPFCCESFWEVRVKGCGGISCFLWLELLLLLPDLKRSKAILKQRTGKCFILSLLVYGLSKKGRPWICYFYIYFVKVISVQIYGRILLIPSVVFFCWVESF